MYTIDKITLRTPSTTTIKTQLDALTLRVDTNEQHLDQNDAKLVTLETTQANHSTKLTKLETGLNAKLDTSTFNTEKTTLTNLINTKANNTDVVKLTTDQTIDGNKIFNKHLVIAADNDDIGLTLKGRQNKAVYLRVVNHNNARLGYIGRGSNQTENMYLGSDIGDVIITCPANKKIDFDGKTVEISKTPTQNVHATNKKYVDDTKAALKTEIKNIAANAADFAAFKTALAGW